MGKSSGSSGAGRARSVRRPEPARGPRARWFRTCRRTRPPPAGSVATVGPRGVSRRNEEVGVDGRHLIGQAGEEQVLRHQRVLQGEDRLHHAQGPGRGLTVAEIRLDRRECAPLIDAVHRRQAGEFDRVTDRGTGAVRLDHADGRRVNLGGGQGVAVDLDLRRLGGVAMLTVRPSWLAAVPRMTTKTRSPSRSASDNRLRNSTTLPSPETNPSAATSKAWRCPVGDSIPCSEPDTDLRGSSVTEIPPARAISLSPSCRLRQAWCSATNPDEQAVSTVTAGPCRPST